MRYWFQRMFPWLSGLMVVVTVFTATLAALWFIPVRWSAPSLLITPGMSERGIAQRVASANVSYPAWLTTLLVRSFGGRSTVHYGEYRLDESMSLSQLLTHLTDQSGLVQHHVTFIEGWTFAQIKRALLHDDTLNHAMLSGSNTSLLKAIGVDATHPEGLFYPDTYHYVWGSSALRILKQSHQLMNQVLQKAWEKRAIGVPYQTPYEALIVASMIEVESPTLSERPLIAGVILARLKKGMRLQIDPTVLYGVGKPFGSPITKKDLTTITPYNTYRHSGLPPTPIDMPSRSSIEAALHPINKGYLYYVSNGDGTHTFSSTYAKHQQGVARYRKIEKQRKQRKQREQLPLSSSLPTLKLEWQPLMMRSLQWFIFNG